VQHDAVIVILAGGAGKRLWPLSTAERPKQFAPLFAGRSMLQLTFARAAEVAGADAVYLVGNAQHADLYLDQLPRLARENLILEPVGRGTAAAVALAAVVCARTAPRAVVATIPSDHVIPDSAEWVESLRTALDFARDGGYLVCLGTPPRRGESKFGYLVAGETLGGTALHPVKSVRRFVEKPDVATLDDLVESGSCLRNTGIIAFRPELLISEMEQLAPDTYRPIAEAMDVSQEALQRAYAAISTRSADEAILQRTKRIAVTLGRAEITDAGDFRTLGDALGRDDQGNAFVGRVVAVDSIENTVVAPGVTVALVGVSGLVVVVEGDHILVCPADETQRIKEISEK